MGLVISLGTARSANAIVVTSGLVDRGGTVEQQRKVFENTVKTSGRSTGPFGLPEACNLPIIYNPKDPRAVEFNNNMRKAFDKPWDPAKRVYAFVKDYQPQSVKDCLKKTRNDYEKKLEKFANNKQVSIEADAQMGIRAGAYGIDRLSLGKPGIGPKIYKNIDYSKYQAKDGTPLKRWETKNLKVNPDLWVNLGGDKNYGTRGWPGPYADPKNPQLGRDNQKIQQYAERKGVGGYTLESIAQAQPSKAVPEKFGGAASKIGYLTK